MHAIGRLFAMAFGYTVAVAMAAASLIFMHVGAPPTPPDEAVQFWLEFILYGSMTASMIGAACALPVLIFALLAETFRLRSFTLHTGFGAVIAGVISLWARQVDLELIEAQITPMIATGIIGGAVYWLLAGRFSGWLSTT